MEIRGCTVERLENLIEIHDEYLSMRASLFGFCRELFMLSEIAGSIRNGVSMPERLMPIGPDAVYVSGLYEGMIRITFTNKRCDYPESYLFPVSFLGNFGDSLSEYGLMLGANVK
jgi:hypothetical protein